MPELGKGTACIHTPAPQSGLLNGERGSHFRPPWRPVARDLSPLPLPEVLQISEDAHSLSRPVRQRLLRRRAMDLRVAETVQALNFLDWHTWDPTCRPSQAHNAACEAIRREVELSPPPLDGSSPEATRQELLGPLSSKSGEHVAQAAYEPDLVSLPEVAGGCDLASQLEGPDRDCLVSFEESLLLSENAFEEGLPTLHWDDALVGDVYISFVNRLLQSGMLTPSLGCRSQAGIFFVRKRSGRLRMIVDGRQGNQRMRPPPKASMSSAAAFSELRLGQGEKLRVSTYDIQDCFYQFKIPKAFGELLGFKRIQAYKLGVQEVDGRAVAPLDWVLLGFALLSAGSREHRAANRSWTPSPSFRWDGCLVSLPTHEADAEMALQVD